GPGGEREGRRLDDGDPLGGRGDDAPPHRAPGHVAGLGGTGVQRRHDRLVAHAAPRRGVPRSGHARAAERREVLRRGRAARRPALHPGPLRPEWCGAPAIRRAAPLCGPTASTHRHESATVAGRDAQARGAQAADELAARHGHRAERDELVEAIDGVVVVVTVEAARRDPCEPGEGVQLVERVVAHEVAPHGPVPRPHRRVDEHRHASTLPRTCARAGPPEGSPAHVRDSAGQKPPPKSSGPPAGAAGAFSGLSATTASEVRNRPAIEPAFCSAERVTLTGSATPAASRSSYTSVSAFRPWPTGRLRTFSTTTPPSRPAFSAICLSGASIALLTICAPVASSPESSSDSKTSLPAWMSATPPPATMPSSTAAFALRTASSMRCLRSLSSTSVAAPALMTATPPASFARRS